MFAAVGCKVVYLKRIRMGSLTLTDLKKGAYRKLSQEEINRLKEEKDREVLHVRRIFTNFKTGYDRPGY